MMLVGLALPRLPLAGCVQSLELFAQGQTVQV